MSKGNKRGNKEVKKPKQPKKIAAATPLAGFDRGLDPGAGLGSKKKR